MLGHASAAMTLDTYSDLFDDDLDGVSWPSMTSDVPQLKSQRSQGGIPGRCGGGYIRMIPGFSGSETACPWRDSNPQPFP